MLMLLHAPGFQIPDFQFDRLHDSRFQISRLTGPKIPDVQSCTPEVSRDARFARPMFPDSRLPDLHALSSGFQSCDNKVSRVQVSSFQVSGHLEPGNLIKACKSGIWKATSCREPEIRKSRMWNVETCRRGS